MNEKLPPAVTPPTSESGPERDKRRFVSLRYLPADLAATTGEPAAEMSAEVAERRAREWAMKIVCGVDIYNVPDWSDEMITKLRSILATLLAGGGE
jgi:hypothetical protein